jgi:hypothetical protein
MTTNARWTLVDNASQLLTPVMVQELSASVERRSPKPGAVNRLVFQVDNARGRAAYVKTQILLVTTGSIKDDVMHWPVLNVVYPMTKPLMSFAPTLVVCVSLLRLRVTAPVSWDNVMLTPLCPGVVSLLLFQREDVRPRVASV